MYSERDELAKILADAAKCLVISEDSQFWEKRILYFLKCFEAATTRRNLNAALEGKKTGTDETLERVCKALLTRCMYHRW